MANKTGRRFRRHQEKHQDYFDDLARQVIASKRVTVDLDVASFEVRWKPRKHWLEISASGRHPHSETRIDAKGPELVSAIAAALMWQSSRYPGVTIPPP